MLHLAENPMKIGWLVPEIQAIEGFANQLEVNKCAFTFSSEIRQIQCTRRAECIGQASNSGKCIGFVLFQEQK